MKIKIIKIHVFLWIWLTTIACSSQNRCDLETVIDKNIDEIITGESNFSLIEREVVTHQPAYETRHMNQFKWGEVDFMTDEENFDEESYIRLIVNSMEASKVVGVIIHIESNEKQAGQMEKYIIQKYGEPEMLSPEPTPKEDGIMLGNSAYCWLDKQSKSSIFFYKTYAKQNQMQIIGYNLEIIQNDALLLENPELKIIDWYKTRF